MPQLKNPGIKHFRPKKSFDHPRHLIRSTLPPPSPGTARQKMQSFKIRLTVSLADQQEGLETNDDHL